MLVEPPPPPPPPQATRSVPKVAGISARFKYSASVVDLGALVAAIAGGKASLSLVQPNSTALNGMARALKDEFKIAGCRLHREPVIASKAQ